MYSRTLLDNILLLLYSVYLLGLL